VAGRRQRFPNITAQEAHAALRWLVATGKSGVRVAIAAARTLAPKR
jgi:hypothetical protein